MSGEDRPGPDVLLVDPEEARGYAFGLVKSLGGLVWGVCERADAMPSTGATDPAFGAAVASINAALRDARGDVGEYTQRVCETVAAIFGGIVTIGELDQEATAELRRRGAEI